MRELPETGAYSHQPSFRVKKYSLFAKHVIEVWIILNFQNKGSPIELPDHWAPEAMGWIKNPLIFMGDDERYASF